MLLLDRNEGGSTEHPERKMEVLHAVTLMHMLVFNSNGGFAVVYFQFWNGVGNRVAQPKENEMLCMP